MTSTIKVNTIQNTCGARHYKTSNTITIGASGDTVTLASKAMGLQDLLTGKQVLLKLAAYSIK